MIAVTQLTSAVDLASAFEAAAPGAVFELPLPDGRHAISRLQASAATPRATPACPPGRAGSSTDLRVQISELLLSARANSIQAAAMHLAQEDLVGAENTILESKANALC
jgi:hypothetical protein